jgi:hypothetical protein
MSVRSLVPALALSLAALTWCERAPRTPEQLQADTVCKEVDTILNNNNNDHLFLALLNWEVAIVLANHDTTPVNGNVRYWKDKMIKVKTEMQKIPKNVCHLTWVNWVKSHTIESPNPSQLLKGMIDQNLVGN